jgi:hypothetical protein
MQIQHDGTKISPFLRWRYWPRTSRAADSKPPRPTSRHAKNRPSPLRPLHSSQQTVPPRRYRAAPTRHLDYAQPLIQKTEQRVSRPLWPRVISSARADMRSSLFYERPQPGALVIASRPSRTFHHGDTRVARCTQASCRRVDERNRSSALERAHDGAGDSWRYQGVDLKMHRHGLRRSALNELHLHCRRSGGICGRSRWLAHIRRVPV